MAETGFNSPLLKPHVQIKYNVTHQTFPQPLTIRSCKIIVCMCESCQAIFHNNILYREITRSRKGTSCTCFANVSQRCDPFLFISMSLKITFQWFGLMSWRIRCKYSQSWNAVLCNNRRTRSEQQQSSRSEQKKRVFSQKMYKLKSFYMFNYYLEHWDR